ncbi:MAG: 5-hydroxyisourate hydrolase [Paracoccaceae bacterium]|jgi:5-hydroxyisourate hydrolase
MSNGRLTTHILDTARGKPAANVAIRLFGLLGGHRHLAAQTITNSDGRTDAPMAHGSGLIVGVYELEFDAGDYLRATEQIEVGPSFLDVVVLRFGVTDADQHYHVPLLLSPFAYSTYRGS